MKKRRFIIVLAVMLSLILTMGLCSCGSSDESADEETTTEAETSPAENLYSLKEDSTVLVVMLDTEKDSDKQWMYEISDTSLLDVAGLTYDTVTTTAAEDGEEATGEEEETEKWMISFKAPAENNGNVKVKFYYVNSAEEMQSQDPDYVFNLTVELDQKITVNSVVK